MEEEVFMRMSPGFEKGIDKYKAYRFFFLKKNLLSL